MTKIVSLLVNQLLRLEKFAQVEHLPSGEADQAAHGKDGKVENARVGRFVRVAHFLFALFHELEIIYDRVGQVLQAAQFDLERLELLRLGLFVVTLRLDALANDELDLVRLWVVTEATKPFGRKADFEQIAHVGGECKLSTVRRLFLIENVIFGVCDLEVDPMVWRFFRFELASHHHILVDFLLDAFPLAGREVKPHR